MRVMYVWCWHLANKIRRYFGRPAKPKQCCRKESNRVRYPSLRDDLEIRICKVCHCRHYEVTVDPGKVGVTL